MKSNTIIIILLLGLAKAQPNWPGTGNKIDPRFTDAKRMEMSGNIKRAKKLYIELINDDPSNHQYYKPLKKILKNSNSLTELEIITIDLIKKNPSNSIYKLDLLEVYLWLDDPKALNLKKKLFNQFRLNQSFLKKLIFTYISNGLDKQAKDMIEELRLEESYKDFYAFELAIHSIAKMNYELALKEFLLVLKYNPKKYTFVSDRLMTFPNEINLMSSLEKILKQSNNNPKAKLLLSDLYYKQEKYYNSWDIIKNIEDSQKWVEFAEELVNDNRLLIAQEIINQILNLTTSRENRNRAVFLLAEIFEKSTMKVDNSLVSSKLFETNYFFNQSFPKIDEQKSKKLYTAIKLYDSIQVNFSNIEANYRLAEINYKIFGDYDKSFEAFNAISKISPRKEIKLKADLSKIDVLISKGHLAKALDIAQTVLAKYSLSDYSHQIKMKINQINFYNMDFINVKNDLLEILKELTLESPSYNNIIDIIGILQLFDKNQEDLKLFSSAQFLLMQNKRIEAISKLKSIGQTSNDIINDLVGFQIAFLYFKQENYDQALQISKKIKGKSFYSEKAIIFQAEINDYILNNKNKAVEKYLDFIEKFPLSIYYDPIRLRLREIAS